VRGMLSVEIVPSLHGGKLFFLSTNLHRPIRVCNEHFMRYRNADMIKSSVELQVRSPKRRNLKNQDGKPIWPRQRINRRKKGV